MGKLGVPVEMASAMQEHMVPAMSLDTEIEGTHVTMHIVRRTFRLASDEELSQAFPSAPSTASLQCLRNYVGSMRPE